MGRSGLGIGDHQFMVFKASQVAESSRELVLIEKQPEDQALRLSSVMGSIEQEVPKRRLRRSEQWGLGMGVVW